MATQISGPAPVPGEMGGVATNLTAMQQPMPFMVTPTMQENQSMNSSASLYVGDLNPEVTEAILFDIFNAIGPVASIRVCRDVTTRRSLGYAYVNFHMQADAERALDTMNYTLIKGTPCRMMWSQRDPSLRKNGAGNVFCKNLDPSIDNKALYDTFSLFGDILSCKVVAGRDGQSKGYGFVHFETPEAADEAIAKINGMMIAGREVFVGRFQKRIDRPGATDWTNVFVKNIPLHWDQARLFQEFISCGPIASAIIMEDDNRQSRGFGFVDFEEHEGAVKAVSTMNEKIVPTKLGEETGIEESEGEDEPESAPTPVDNEAEEYYVEKKDGTVPEEDKVEKNADGTEKKKRKPKKTTILYVTRAQKKVERERELSSKFEQLKLERLNKFAGINCFVKNLHEDVDDEMLRKEFSQYGVITSARVMRESAPDAKPAEASAAEGEAAAPKTLPPSKGFGFVCFSTPEEATRAVSEHNGKMILGKPIYVALAQRKEARRAQLEAHHGQRAMTGRGMPMQAPFMQPQVYYGGMPGMQPRGYYPPGMMAPGALGPAGMGGNRGNMNMPAMPRGMAGPIPYRYPQMFPPGSMMPQPMQGRGPRAGGGRGGAPPRGGGGRQRVFGQNPAGALPPGKFTNTPRDVTQEPLTTANLVNASESDRKNIIGERLFPLIFLVQPQLAGKITGMLLEMDHSELLHLIESPEALNEKIEEAMQVLQAHNMADAPAPSETE